MASYNATINVSVAGVSQFDLVLALVCELETIGRRLSANPINVFGRGQAGDIARTALKPFQDISRAIENGAAAAANSVAKTNLLANTFKTLASNVKIASKEYDDFIRVAGRAAAAAETQNKALETAIDAERRQALGLQPQGVRDLEVARRKTFVENERRRRATATAGLQDELSLQQALLALEEKSAAAANKELQARGEIARLAAQGVNAAAFRAAQTGTALALPAFQERGLQLLDDSVRLNESNRRIEQALNGERQRGVRFLEKQTAEERRQVELGILGARTGALSGSARATGAVPAGGFPVSGPLQSPGFRNTQKQVGKFGENLALGAGFPLLFGGGPGSVAGSVLGSFVGSGFGGQILGGAIGQILDQAIQKTAQLGSALQTLDISQIEESGVRINANLETQIDLVRQAGNAYAAQQLLQQEVFATTGAIPGTIEGITNSVNVLSSAWSEFTAAAGATLGIIGAPFAAALGAAIRIVNLIVKGFNVAASGLAGLIQKTGEWVVELVAGGEALKNIQNFFESLNPAIDEARGKYAPILSDLNSQVLLNRQLLELEKQKTTGKTSDDKDRNVDLTTQQRILTINAEIDNDIREINKGITEATKTQVAEAVRLLNVKRNQKLEEVQIEALVQRQRVAEDAREKAAREAARAAEDAARKAEQARQNALSIFKEEISLANQINSLYVEQVETHVRAAAFIDNEAAGIKKQLSFVAKVYDAKKAVLENDKEAALASARTQKQQAQINEIYERRLAILDTQTSLERDSAQERFNVLAQTPTDAENAANLLQEEIDLLAAKISGQEREYRIRVEIDRLVAAGVPLQDAINQLAVRDQLNQRLEKQKTLQQEVNQAVNDMGAIGMSVIDNLINRTLSWNDVLRNTLKSVGSILMRLGLNMLAGDDGVGFFSILAGSFTGGKRANGGPVSTGAPYLVGERGPELFVPGTGGSVVNNNDLRSAMGAAPGSGGGAPVLNMSFQSTNINGVEYVSRDQLEQAMAQTRRQASRDGAQRGMSMTLDKLQQSPSTRSRVGIR